MPRFLLLLIAFLPILVHAETLALGVFAFRPKPVMEAQYQPLADYLSRSVPGVHIDLQVLDQDEIQARLAAGTLDLILTNPSHFVLLRQYNRLTGAIATLVSVERGTPVSVLGGVILSPAARGDIGCLADLKGKRIAVPGVKYLGGFQAQAFEMLEAGIRVPGDVEVIDLGSHDAVVQALLDGKADAGFVRTGILEAMARENHVPLGALKVINPRTYTGFPFQCSTRLYPEWAFAAMPHVDQSKVRQLARALLNIDADSVVAREVGIAGFTVPGDYLPVENLARALRLPPFEAAPDFTPADVLTRYRGEALAVLAFALVITALSGRLLLSRHRLKRTTRELRRMSQRHELLLDTAGEGIFGTDVEGAITFVNRAACTMLGYDKTELIGIQARTLFAQCQQDCQSDRPLDRHPDCLPDTEECPIDAVMREGLGRRGDDWFVTKTGVRMPVHLIVTTMVEDGEKVGVEAVFQDVTERKLLEEDLIRRATVDGLTETATRSHFLAQLEREWLRIKRKGGTAALVLIDLDRFKPINDTHGHGAGDAVLKTFGRIARAALRRIDLIGRLGGDEFAILLPDTDLAGARQFCERLSQEVAQTSVHHFDALLNITVSMGLTLLTEQTKDADEAITQADIALYSAKAGGRNRLAVADDALPGEH